MVRLILIVVVFLLSLLCIFKAPTYHLWFASILVSEFPWIFLGLIVVLFLGGFRSKKLPVISNALCILSFIVFLSPIIRARMVASRLPADLAASFGPSVNDEKDRPFQATGMITRIGAKKITGNKMVYSTQDGVDLSLDFYPAGSQGMRPCVVVIHGGSWTRGDRHQLPEINSFLTTKGYHVASIDYRLAPKYQNPAPVVDIRSAIHYLRNHKTELKIDTGRFILLGRSAGGQLALLAAYTLGETGLKGVISFYGPADMVWGYSVPSNPLVLDSQKVMEDYLGGTYGQVPQNYVASSPVEAVQANSVPTLLIHGKNDPMVSYQHSIRLSARLKSSGVSHFLLTLPWATHGCEYTLNGPSGQLSTYAIEYFLKQVTR